MSFPETAEHRRLLSAQARTADWKAWGPYVSDRAWGTVREDYSPDGEAWDSFPHEQASYRAYRWSEDGLGGFCNRFQNVCLAVALWNEYDPILKERFFGVSGPEGNHGEDVKEYYWHLDGTPTHSYMRMLYRYPQVEYPYEQLVAESRRRSRTECEPELLDVLGTVFRERRFFDVVIEYAKAAEEDIICRISATNQGPAPATLHVLPHLWYRNTWSWGHNPDLPRIRAKGPAYALSEHRHLGTRHWYVDSAGPPERLMFTENNTNFQRLNGQPNPGLYVKDAFHAAVIDGRTQALNPHGVGSKAAGHFQRKLAPGETWHVYARYRPEAHETPFADAAAVIDLRRREADEYYAAIQRPSLSDDEKLVQRQAFAGLLWNKQFYHYSAELWLNGDPTSPKPAPSRASVRNSNWRHLYNLDVISMPDKWEYPWFASWDLAFHAIPIALIDPEWAKRQLVLMLREWYMHPSGQIPAYEWDFSAVNPPVHAWACWRVYKISRNVTGVADRRFLQEVFHKLLLNFTWWVNRKDSRGDNVFSGGFLGLDNIGVFDRSQPLPGGATLEQADGTAWMGMFCLNMLAMALELAREDDAYEPIATKFFEHFVYIADAINNENPNIGLWDERDGFYYDRMRMKDGSIQPMHLRSFVGLTPLFAVETIDPEVLERLPQFRRRLEWFIRNRGPLLKHMASLTEPLEGGRRLLALVDRRRLELILGRMLDPDQFLSPYGLRSMSRQYLDHPFVLKFDGQEHRVQYEPAESSSFMFGGNSNWRGPVWFPVNFLMIESLQKMHHYYGDALKVEYPRYSGHRLTLDEVATNLSRRLCHLFLRSPESGERPAMGDIPLFQSDPLWRDNVWFHEYFHGDLGAGLGASHQTGWTALVAKLLQQSGGSE